MHVGAGCFLLPPKVTAGQTPSFRYVVMPLLENFICEVESAAPNSMTFEDGPGDLQSMVLEMVYKPTDGFHIPWCLVSLGFRCLWVCKGHPVCGYRWAEVHKVPFADSLNAQMKIMKVIHVCRKSLRQPLEFGDFWFKSLWKREILSKLNRACTWNQVEHELNRKPSSYMLDSVFFQIFFFCH